MLFYNLFFFLDICMIFNSSGIFCYVYYHSWLIQPPIHGCLGLKIQCLTQCPCVYIYIFYFVWIEYMWTWQKSGESHGPCSEKNAQLHVFTQTCTYSFRELRNPTTDPRLRILSSLQSLSRVQLFSTSWTTARQASLSITNSQSLLTHVHWVSDAIQPSHPLSPPSPASQLGNPGYTVKNSLLYS